MNFLRVSPRRLFLIPAIFSLTANAQVTEPPNASPLPDLPHTTINQDSQTVKGLDGWYFLSTEIEHLLTAQNQIPQVTEAPAIKEIRSYADALETLGIKLVVMPIPEKSLIRMDGLIDPAQLNDAK